MFQKLSSSHDNGQSMVIYPYGMQHAMSVLLSSHDNVQRMVIYHSCMKHTPTVVIVS